MRKEVTLVFMVAIAIILLIASCNWRSGGVDTQTNSEDSSGMEKPEYAKIIVDNLRMRDTWGLNGKEITQIGIGQFVRLTGQLSDTAESISIRGKSQPHFWYEIIFNSDTGWIYGGGMQKLDSLDATPGGGLNDFKIEPGKRVGLITSSTTHESLLEILGPDVVVKGVLSLGEGETIQGTIVYPKSKNEVLIYWESEDFNHIHQVVISKSGGDWHTSNGIQIDQPLKDVNKINGEPFELTGFEWDLAGTSLNWQGGKLDSHLRLKFDYHGDISVYPFLIGDKVISSNNSSLLKLNPTVRQIIVSFTE